jgi:hypothetical protein
VLKQSDPADVLLELKKQANPQHFWNSTETLLLLLAIIFLVAILFLWAAYIRKPRRKRSVGEDRNPKAVLKISRQQGQGRVRKSRLKKRNPTLAETGGLPPRKQECVVSNSR